MQNSLGWQEVFQHFFLPFSCFWNAFCKTRERECRITPFATHQLFKAVRTQENKNQTIPQLFTLLKLVLLKKAPKLLFAPLKQHLRTKPHIVLFINSSGKHLF